MKKHPMVEGDRTRLKMLHGIGALKQGLMPRISAQLTAALRAAGFLDRSPMD
jgi:hypothetical protein